MNSAPRDTYEAAAWLRNRHPWLDELLTRVVGTSEPGEWSGRWLDELVRGFTDLVETNLAWADYERRNPAPAEDEAFGRWQESGPTYTTEAGRCLAPMSGGEIRMLRLLTTLGQGDRVAGGWRVDDIDFDQRGIRVLEDWLQIVRAQMS